MISVILYGRNDSYGYNLHKRGAISFNCIAEVLTHPDDEIIFVDTNTPDDLPTFPEAIRDTLTPRAKKLLRVLRVRPAAYERHKNGTRMKVLEPLCRNVGIRRCNPKNRWVLNSNTDMVFVPVKPGQALSEAVEDLPEGLYELPRFEMPEMLWESVDRANPQSIMERFQLWGRRLHINEMVLGNPENVFDGPGDFQLAPRKQLFAIHGMNEQMVLGWHVDSNLCRRLYLLNGRTHSLLERYHAYHCDHTRVNTMMHTAEGGTANDWRKFVNDVATPYLPEQAQTWGMPDELVEEIRLTDQQATRYHDVLSHLLPGLQEPMLKSALVGEAFNHGLLYDNQHTLPYITDHLSQIPPPADVGYVGANSALLKQIAAFRQGFGHTGRVLYDPAAMEAGQDGGAASLPVTCVATEVNALYQKAFVLCLDLWMGNFAARRNSFGYTVPKPSPEGGRFAALMMRRLQDFARREKAHLDECGARNAECGIATTRSGIPQSAIRNPQSKKFLFLGTQNTWFENAASQLISIILAPYSSYTRHGMVRKDAFTKPFQPVPGHHLLVGECGSDAMLWAEKELGRPVRLFEFELAMARAEALMRGPADDPASATLRKELTSSEVGRVVLKLRASMAETDGQLAEAESLRAILAAPSECGVQNAQSMECGVRSAECGIQTSDPTPQSAIRCPVIGIDIRTLFYSDSAARGVGHHTRYHVQHLAQCRPDWRFELYANSSTPPPVLESLLALPNVRLKLFRDYKPGDIDLFHIPDPLCLKPDYVSPMTLMPGVRTTITFHDLAGLRVYLGAYKPPQRLEYLERLEQLLQPRFRLLTVSEFTRRDLVNATGCSPDKGVAIWAGLNHAENQAPITPAVIRRVRAKYGINRRFLLHVGALDPHKNFEAVVKVLAQLKSHDLQLVVVGEKEHYLKQVAEYTESLKMTQILFPGFIPRADLEALYHDAVGLVFLSLYEGFGFPVLEAMAQGCPVLTSKVTSLPEVAGDAALLFAPNDVKAVSLGVEQLLNSPGLRRAMAEKGRARAAQFTWGKTAQKTIAVWEEMLGCDAESHSPTPLPHSAIRTPHSLKTPVVWFAPWRNPSGYCTEALAFAKGLADAIPFQAVDAARTKSAAFVEGLPAETQQMLSGLLTDHVDLSGKIAVLHIPGSAFAPTHTAAYDVGRTMFETDRLPEAWVARCNLLDEIWVPSRFNLETFAASGVERDKLVVIPQAVDETLFNPHGCEPWPLPNCARFNFLSIFEWSSRKGWDTLLAAYLREFSAEDDVCLYLRTYLVDQPDADPRAVLEPVLRKLAAALNLGGKPLPRVEILSRQIPTRDLPRLYRAAQCLVAPSYGEGWGRPHHEAMMMGVPVIATNWSGNTEFMTEQNSYLLDYELAPVTQVEPAFAHYLGHRWANPSVAHLRTLMRHAQQNPDAARAKGQKAREQMLAQYSLKPVAQCVLSRLAEIEARLTTPACPAVTARSFNPPPVEGFRKVHLAWEGSFLDFGSLSHVNRELTEALGRETNVELSCVDPRVARGGAAMAPALRETARHLKTQAPKDTQITVRHEWPPRWTAPANGAWVLLQPWEYGALPAEWVQRLQAVDEVWVPSSYVRRVYVDSGVAPTKVKVVPNGIDPDKFHPGVAPMPLATSKSFKFLFVGGTIHRKGPDLLLNAFLSSFSADDDVCLVIKDFGGQSVYAGQTIEAAIRATQARPGAPEILYLNQELPPEAIPGLYAACDCLVHPYRGEGFGLPVLEAMACGLPVVVTGGGATDDFADDAHAYRIPALRRHFGSEISGMKLVRAGWLLEPDADALAERLKWVVSHREEARAKGRAASDFVRSQWTWANAARIANVYLQGLAERCETRSSHPAASATRPAHSKSAPIALPPCALIGHLAHARSLLGQKKFADAWASTLAAIKARPFHPEAYLLLAELAQAAGDSRSARRCAQHARRLAPGWKPAQRFLKGKLYGAAKPAWLTLPESIQQSESGAQTPKSAGEEPQLTDRLTVCLITRNEEKFLGQCLASVRGLADQIVVVDTGSEDRTVEIAREHGAEIHHFDWCDDFSAARNAALEHATGDWVLMLDADEEVPPDSHPPLRALLRSPSVMAWRLPIIDVGREAEGRSYVPRLFRNAPALFYVGRVHEQVFSSVEVRRQEWGLENRLGEAPLRHHGYRPEVVKERNKIERNLRLLEKAIEEMPGEPSLLMNYGLELTRSGQADTGLEQYRQAFAIMSAQPSSLLVPETREMLLAQFCTQLMARRRFDEVVEVLTSPLAKAGGLAASLHFSLGLAYLERKQFAEAATQMGQCIAKRGQPALAPINTEILKAGPRHCLALCQERLGQTEAAAQTFRQAVDDDPQSSAVRLDHARFLAEHGQPVDAMNLLFAFTAERPAELPAWHLGAQIALSRPEFLEVALDWTTEAHRLAPQHPALLQQRAEALTLSGQCQTALPFWRQLPSATNPAMAAALVLCETVRDENRFSPAPHLEALIGREFLKWYQRLMKWGQQETVAALNARVELLEVVLPSAARSLAGALSEAHDQAPGSADAAAPKLDRDIVPQVV